MPWLFAASLSATACASSDCEKYGAFAVSVEVVDSSGIPVCDAVVTATDHEFSEVLTLLPGTPCRYAGVAERKGTYSIEAARNGLTKMVDGVKVTADDCHVRTASVNIALSA